MSRDEVNGEEIGYRKPPRSTRFQKGRSGNPKGRPKGKRNDAPYEAVLGQVVTIREDGAERRVTAAEAFLLHLAKTGLEGDGASARQAMAAIEKARADQVAKTEDVHHVVTWMTSVEPGSVSPAIEPLRMGRKLDRHRETARMMLEPWIVEAALKRLDDRRLTVEEQKVVVEATRTPGKVKWPDWQEVRQQN